MLTSLLLSAGSSVIIILCVVIWMVSVVLKIKKKIKSLTYEQPQKVDISEDAEEACVAEHQQQHKHDNSMSTPSEGGVRATCGNDNIKPMAANEVDMPKPEYSLDNPEDARRAIIYSEIFKPKF